LKRRSWKRWMSTGMARAVSAHKKAGCRKDIRGENTGLGVRRQGQLVQLCLDIAGH
jgi:hypothetical protein